MLLPLLAQANPKGPPPELMLFIFGFLCVFLLIALIPTIFFLLTLQKALKRCSPRNRTQEPAMVWISLIPLVGLVWQFINVIRVSESLKNEFRDRGWHSRSEDYGHGIGIAYCSLAIASIIPYCGSLFAIAGLVCWIIYWVKVANLSGQIANPSFGDRYDDEYDDEYDDDRPPRRGRRDEDDREDDRDDRRGGDRKPWERE